MRLTRTCLLIIFITNRSRRELKYDDCDKLNKRFINFPKHNINNSFLGSLFEIVDVTFFECRGYLCPINMKGEQEITLHFKTRVAEFTSTRDRTRL